MTVFTLLEYGILHIAIPSDVLAVLMGFWGGELLIVALRQVFGSDIIKRKNKDIEGDLP